MIDLEPAAPLPTLVAVGTSGIDYSRNNGATWISRMEDKPWSGGKKPAEEKSGEEKQPYNAVSCVDSICWAVGPAGRVAKLPHPLTP